VRFFLQIPKQWNNDKLLRSFVWPLERIPPLFRDHTRGRPPAANRSALLLSRCFLLLLIMVVIVTRLCYQLKVLLTDISLRRSLSPGSAFAYKNTDRLGVLVEPVELIDQSLECNWIRLICSVKMQVSPLCDKQVIRLVVLFIIKLIYFYCGSAV